MPPSKAKSPGPTRSLGRDAVLHSVKTRYFPEIWYALENWFQLIKKRKRVLEAGYGIGLVAEALAKSGWDVTAIDPSLVALSELRDRFAKGSLNAAFEQADIDKLPFANQSFDAVVSINSLEFVHNPAEALQEISRVLVPGGRAVIATFNKISPWGMTGVARLIRPEPDPSTPRFVSKSDLTRLLKAAGFIVDGIKERACYLPSSSALGKLKLPLAGAFVAMVSKEAPKFDQSGEKNPPKAKNFILEK